jgi:hypothetical protein
MKDLEAEAKEIESREVVYFNYENWKNQEKRRE